MVHLNHAIFTFQSLISFLFCPGQVKELQKQTGVRIKVITNNENTESNEAIILIEESFASGQVSQKNHDFVYCPTFEFHDTIIGRMLV